MTGVELSKRIFKAGQLAIGLLALTALVLCLIAIIVGDSQVLPWHVIPTYVKTPLFLEYFRLGNEPFGFTIDQVLVWQHHATGDYIHLAWPDAPVLSALFLTLVVISITFTYLPRALYLFCMGLMLLVLMQLNLAEMGLFPESINYITLFVFGATTHFFQSIKPDLPLTVRALAIILVYGLFALAVGYFSPIASPVSSAVAFGLHAPLILIALFLLFIGGDNVQILFKLATSNAPTGKNGLYHFIAIGFAYLVILTLLFLDQIGQLDLNLWLISPSVLLIVSTISGYLCLNDKLEASKTPLPPEMIRKWLYPAMALLALVLLAYASITGNDTLEEALELSILATHLAGAVIYYFYALANFTAPLLQNRQVLSFFDAVKAPLLTARALYIIFIVGVFFYLDSAPFYQARSARYTTIGVLGERLDNDLLAAQYYKQALFYDYYSFKANYSLGRLERKNGNTAEVVEKLKSAGRRDNRVKANIALSNFYSENDQLFAKILTLKSSDSESFRVTNNLGIAHLEFSQYDSALMAFNKSQELEDNASVEANKLALYYQTRQSVASATPPGLTRVQINAQALANISGEEQPFVHNPAPDTVLFQDDLYYLFNSSLNRSPTQSSEKREALHYYLSHTHNTGLKDFLLPALAIQLYEAGEVNKAFGSLQEIRSIDYRNNDRYAFMLAIWAAQQGSMTETLQLLSEISQISPLWQQAENLKLALLEEGTPVLTESTFPSLTELTKEDRLQKLKALATQNAFNVALTLQTVEALKSEGLPNNEVYEILRQSLQVNRLDTELTKAFAWQAIASGLSSFGRSALERLEGVINDQQFRQLMEDFEAELTAWQNRAPE